MMKYSVQIKYTNPAHEHVSLRRRVDTVTRLVEANSEQEAINRAANQQRSLGFMVREANVLREAEQIDELDKKTLQSYKSKAQNEIESMAKSLRGKEYKNVDPQKMRNRASGIKLATAKLKSGMRHQKEEVEQIDSVAEEYYQRRRQMRRRRLSQRSPDFIGKPGTYNREGIMLGKDGHPLIKTGKYRDWLFKTSHENAVAEVKVEHGEPTNHEYKFDSMSGRYGAHNSHLHYPGKKITVNTQMHKSGPRDTLQPVNNVFVSRNEQGVSEEIKGNHRPGWMLRADPELAKKIKERKERQKKREAAYGNPSAGKSVKEELLPKQKEIQESLVSSELAQNKKTNSTEYGRRVAAAVRAARRNVNTQPITDTGKGQDA